MWNHSVVDAVFVVLKDIKGKVLTPSDQLIKYYRFV